MYKENILTVAFAEDKVFRTRSALVPSESQLPLHLKVSNNIKSHGGYKKSPGETYEYFGFDFEELVSFLTDSCVFLSLARNSNNIRIFISQTPSQGRFLNDDRFRAENVVCPEIFHD
jgi:hypothetical protein